MKIALIAAIARNGVIGNCGQLPWHLPEDLQYFKKMTMGLPMLMGHTTFRSLPGILPGRPHLVISRQQQSPLHPAVFFFSSIPEALDQATHMGTPLMVIGGAQVYHQTIAMADTLYLTRVDADFPGDTFFPGWDSRHFILRHSEDHRSLNGLGHVREIWEARPFLAV